MLFILRKENQSVRRGQLQNKENAEVIYLPVSSFRKMSNDAFEMLPLIKEKEEKASFLVGV